MGTETKNEKQQQQKRAFRGGYTRVYVSVWGPFRRLRSRWGRRGCSSTAWGRGCGPTAGWGRGSGPAARWGRGRRAAIWRGRASSWGGGRGGAVRDWGTCSARSRRSRAVDVVPSLGATQVNLLRWEELWGRREVGVEGETTVRFHLTTTTRERWRRWRRLAIGTGRRGRGGSPSRRRCRCPNRGRSGSPLDLLRNRGCCCPAWGRWGRRRS